MVFNIKTPSFVHLYGYVISIMQFNRGLCYVIYIVYFLHIVHSNEWKIVFYFCTIQLLFYFHGLLNTALDGWQWC